MLERLLENSISHICVHAKQKNISASLWAVKIKETVPRKFKSGLEVLLIDKQSLQSSFSTQTPASSIAYVGTRIRVSTLVNLINGPNRSASGNYLEGQFPQTSPKTQVNRIVITSKLDLSVVSPGRICRPHRVDLEKWGYGLVNPINQSPIKIHA